MIARMATAGKFARMWMDAEAWALGGLHRLYARTRRGPATAPHLATGMDGERAAYSDLKRRGYRVVARRWTSARVRGDIDLVAWHGDLLCFIEVKTRSERDSSPAESAVDEDKREMVRGLARAYLRTLPESERGTVAVRFDVVSVYMTDGAAEVEVFQNAFGWQ